MIKIKKNNFLKAAFIMIAVMMLATSLISGTIAKYVSNGEISAGLTLKVAEWKIDVANDQQLGKEISLTDADFAWTIMKEDDTEFESSENKIAPGTWGYAPIEIKNDGDVNAVLKINVNITLSSKSDIISTGLSIMVVVSETQPDSYDTDNDASLTFKSTFDEIPLESKNSTNIYICYKWEFEVNEETNKTDTKMIGDTLVLNGTITITAEQAK